MDTVLFIIIVIFIILNIYTALYILHDRNTQTRSVALEKTGGARRGGHGQTANSHKFKIILCIDYDFIEDLYRELLADDKRYEIIKYSPEVRLDPKVKYGMIMRRQTCLPYFTKSFIKSVLKVTILEKTNFSHLMLSSKNPPDYIAETHIITRENYRQLLSKIKIDEMNPWIWKPSGGSIGRGIKVVPDEQTLHKIMAMSNFFEGYPITKELVRSIHGDGILCRYIKNPILLNNKKCHLRIYYIMFALKNAPKSTSTYTRQYAVCKQGFIIPAKEDYKHGDYHNGLIHDSHVMYKYDLQHHPRFPEEFDVKPKIDLEWVYTGIKNILADVSERVNDEIGIFEEGDSGFNICGCDFMIDVADEERPKLYLIEINRTARGWDSKPQHIFRIFHTYIVKCMIRPYLERGVIECVDSDDFMVVKKIK